MTHVCAIDAPSIAGVIDRDLSAWTPESLREAFLRHGCAVVRNAVPRDVLDRIQVAVDKAYETKNDVHVYDRDIKSASKGALSGFEIVGDAKLKRFLDLVYAGQWYFKKNATARRIKGSELNSNWQDPLALHLDSQIHRFQFTVNFWVPLQDCGVEAPSLQVVPLDYIRTRSYAGYTGRLLREGETFHLGYFSKNALDVEAISAAFGETCLLHPVMRKGDLIVASNWLIHGSYRTAAMRNGRTSVELRFIGTDLDIAPHLDTLTSRIAHAITGRANTNFVRPAEPSATSAQVPGVEVTVTIPPARTPPATG